MVNEWDHMECTGCDVTWKGTTVPCWCCGGSGSLVPPTVIVGAMRWDERVLTG